MHFEALKQNQEKGVQMKLKLIGLLTVTILTSLAQAEGQRQLICQSENEHLWVTLSAGGWGSIVYNYSSASVSCAHNALYYLKDVSTLRCYGSWHSDSEFKTAHKVVDSLAWVEITNDGKNITARTQTNRVYGSQKLKLKCEIKNVGER